MVAARSKTETGYKDSDSPSSAELPSLAVSSLGFYAAYGQLSPSRLDRAAWSAIRKRSYFPHKFLSETLLALTTASELFFVLRDLESTANVIKASSAKNRDQHLQFEDDESRNEIRGFLSRQRPAKMHRTAAGTAEHSQWKAGSTVRVQKQRHT